jgi:alpha-ketoglutarate-dependent taurine dioxygenase
MVEATALHPNLATEIHADIRVPLTPEVKAGIVSIMDHSPVGVFRNARPLGDDEQVAFGRQFEQVERTYSLLSAQMTPSDGSAPAEFADMRAVYDALPEEMKSRLESLVAEHDEPRPRLPVRHPLVHEHPGSKRKTIYLPSQVSRIVGYRKEDTTALLEYLTAFSAQPQFVYSHVWRVGDVVMWDNLAATPAFRGKS